MINSIRSISTPPPPWGASPSKGYPSALKSPIPIYSPGCREEERGTVRVKCL